MSLESSCPSEYSFRFAARKLTPSCPHQHLHHDGDRHVGSYRLARGHTRLRLAIMWTTMRMHAICLSPLYHQPSVQVDQRRECKALSARSC